MKKTFILTFTLISTTAPAIASIPSSAYMREQVASQIATAISSKVDTSASANQTMAGTYTVSGTMNFTGIAYAPTAELPPPPTDSGDSGDDEELGGSNPSYDGGGGAA